MGKQKDTKQFILDAVQVHGSKYNYSKTNYKKSNIKITITCPIHGDFEQTPNNHLRGKGCIECGHIVTGKSRLSNVNDFIQKANIIHKNKYAYNDMNYINSKSKIIIVCPIHGKFDQTPHAHLQKQGCPKCGGTKKLTTFEFCKKAQQIHRDRYDYSKVNYVTAKDKVEIICHKHGSFQQNPAQHLSGHNCPQCAKEELSSTTQEFIKKAKRVHNKNYNYSNTIYEGVKTKVEIICPIHGSFWQRPDIHLANHGCPSCIKGGFNPSKPGILYYVQVIGPENQKLYKIGITNKSIKERFKDELSKIKVIKQQKYQNGQEAYDIEQKILKHYKKFQYTGLPILVSGNTELFAKDVLNLTNTQKEFHEYII